MGEVDAGAVAGAADRRERTASMHSVEWRSKSFPSLATPGWERFLLEQDHGLRDEEIEV